MKTNAVVLIICSVLYLAVIAYVVWRLTDIRCNRHKYEQRELQARAEKLESGNYNKFFQSLSHQYCFLTFLIAIALTGLTILLGFGCIRLIAGGRQTVTDGNSLIGATLSLFVNLILGMVIIPLHIKTDVCAVAVSGTFKNVKDRAEIAKLGYTLFAVFFGLCFPLMALSCNSYICYDETGVYTSQFFQLEEVYTPYGEVQNVKICISHDSYGNTGDFEYVLTLIDGESVNINKPNLGCRRFEKSTFQIHKYLEAKAGCTAEVVTPTAEDLHYINNKLDAERREIALYILEGFHR